MPDLYPNATLPLLWVIFMTVFFVLNRFVFKPTLTLLSERQKNTSALADKAVLIFEETQTLLTSYEQKMAEARLKAAREREIIVGQARSQEREVIQKAREANEKLLATLQGQIQQEKKEAELQLRQYAQGLAREMVSRILERRVA